MTTPTHEQIDDAAFDDTRETSLSVWHYRRMSENARWSLNNRQGEAGIAFTTWTDGGAVAAPTFASVREVAIGPIPVYAETASVRVRVGYTVTQHAVYLRAASDAVANTETGATATLAVGSGVASLNVTTQPGVEQLVWLYMRSERETDKADVTDKTYSFLVEAYEEGRGGYQEVLPFGVTYITPTITTPVVLTGITHNTAPRMWAGFAGGGAGKESVPAPQEYLPDYCFTIAYADDDGEADGDVRRIVLAEDFRDGAVIPGPGQFQLPDRYRAQQGSIVYGTLGILQVKAISVNPTPGLDVEGAPEYRRMRFIQPASSQVARRIVDYASNVRRWCMPVVGYGLDTRDHATDADYPGIWETSGGSADGAAEDVASYATATTIARWAYRTDQEYRPSATPSLRATIPYYLAVNSLTAADPDDGEVDQQTYTSTMVVRNTAGASVLSSTISLQVDQLAARTPVPLLYLWVRATQHARAFTLAKDAVTSGTYGSRFGMDGCTPPNEIGAWKVATIDLDASTLTAGTDYSVEIQIENTSSLETYTVAAFAHPIVRATVGG
jgi:hypothetical protein